jgi:hypothetical protein
MGEVENNDDHDKNEQRQYGVDDKLEADRNLRKKDRT